MCTERVPLPSWAGSARSCGAPGTRRSSSSSKSRDRRSGPAARLRCRRSCAPRTPCRRRTADRPIGEAEPLQHLLGARRHALVLGARTPRAGRWTPARPWGTGAADHAARVLAGGARLRAEARRPGGEAQRQLLSRPASCRPPGWSAAPRRSGSARDPLVGVEHVLGEFRQLADAERGVVAHQQRRIDLGVAALASCAGRA